VLCGPVKADLRGAPGELAGLLVEIVLDLAFLILGDIGLDIVKNGGICKVRVQGFGITAVDDPAEGTLENIAQLAGLESKDLLRGVLGLEISLDVIGVPPA